MSDFLTLAESKQKFVDGVSKSASFIATVIKEGELDGGTTNGKDWTKKKFTIEDASAIEEITLWGDEINKIKVGYKYEFNSPYWKDYKGTPQLSLGQYCDVKCIGNADVQSKLDSAEIPPAPKGVGSPNGEEIPEPSETFRNFIIDENIILAQIEQVVIEEMKKYNPLELNGQKVGLRVKEIYRESKKSNFQKQGGN